MSSLEFRLKKFDETRTYLFFNDLISGKYKKTCKYLNYVEKNAYFSFNSYWLCFSF